MQELKTLRDAVVVTCLGFFVIITDFLYSQTMPPLPTCWLQSLWLTATLIAFQDHNALLAPLRALRICRHAAAAGRAAHGWRCSCCFRACKVRVFGFPQATSAGVTGLSDSMSPGSLSQLSLSDEVAFRVQFHSPPPKPQHLYWRGPVMWDFDGRTWTIGTCYPPPLPAACDTKSSHATRSGTP